MAYTPSRLYPYGVWTTDGTSFGEDEDTIKAGDLNENAAETAEFLLKQTHPQTFRRIMHAAWTEHHVTQDIDSPVLVFAAEVVATGFGNGNHVRVLVGYACYDGPVE